MLNIALEPQQQQCQQNDLIVIKAEINRETDLYYVGRFDGIIGDEPSQPENPRYWNGYCSGLEKYWTKKLKVEIVAEN